MSATTQLIQIQILIHVNNFYLIFKHNYFSLLTVEATPFNLSDIFMISIRNVSSLSS